MGEEPFGRRKRMRGTKEAVDCGGVHQITCAQAVLQQRDNELAELRKLLAHKDEQLAHKDEQLASASSQCTQLHTMQQAAQRECERLAGENKILKRAVAIQNEKLDGAHEQVRQLQHKNYALAVHLQPSSAVSSPITQNPRWLS